MKQSLEQLRQVLDSFRIGIIQLRSNSTIGIINDIPIRSLPSIRPQVERFFHRAISRKNDFMNEPRRDSGKIFSFFPVLPPFILPHRLDNADGIPDCF